MAAINLSSLSIMQQGPKIYGVVEPPGIQIPGIIIPQAPKSYLPSQQNIPEQIRQSAQYAALLEQIKPYWQCFVSPQEQIFQEPANPQCSQIWTGLHKTIPPQFHLQFVRDLIFKLQQPPQATESTLTKYLPFILIGGGVGLYLLLS